MGFVARTPAPPLSAFVSQLWDCEIAPLAPRLERILPQPSAGLIINLQEDETRTYDSELRCQRRSGSVLAGPHSQSFVIDTTEQTAVMGVQFHPGGAYAFFAERIDLLDNRHTPLEDILGHYGRCLRERLLDANGPVQRLARLEQWLIRRLRRAAPNALLAHALSAIDRFPQVQRIENIAGHCGVGIRRFSQMFREQVGLSPKRYCRVRRFQSILAQAHRLAQIDWAGLAIDGGFYDQAHFVHEFRAFAGVTPTQYASLRGEHVNHLPLPV